MKNSLSITLSALLLICPIGIVAHAQDSKPDTATEAEKLPTPQELVDLMVEFSGGAEALKDVKPVKSTGTFSIPQMQMTGEMTSWSAPPNLMRVDIKTPGIGIIMSGFNGKIGWSLDPTRGPSLMEGPMLDQIKMESDPASLLDLSKYFDSVEVVGRVDFEGAKCFQLQLKKGKAVRDMFVEEKTGRMVGMKAVMPSPMGEIPTTTVIEKWMNVGPRKIAAKTVIKMMGMDQVMQIDTVSSDKFDPDVFDLPPAIQALADAQSKKAADSEDDPSSTGSNQTPSSKESSSSSSRGGGR